MILHLAVGRRAVGVILFLLTSGCGVHFKPGPLYQEMAADDLPDDSLSLLSLAHAAYSPYGPVSSIRLSLAAAEKVLAQHPQYELGCFYSARAIVWLLEFDETLPSDEIRNLAEQGFERIRTVADRNADRVEYVFLAGALLGNAIRYSPTQGLVQVRRVHDYFRRAVGLDPSYDEGAPLRALGTLLVKAPPWPTGVGNVDEGIELLEEAVRLFPSHPANHLYAAEALAADGRDDEAVAAYHRVVELCRDPRWDAVGLRYRSRAQTALAKLAPGDVSDMGKPLRRHRR